MPHDPLPAAPPDPAPCGRGKLEVFTPEIFVAMAERRKSKTSCQSQRRRRWMRDRVKWQCCWSATNAGNGKSCLFSEFLSAADIVQTN